MRSPNVNPPHTARKEAFLRNLRARKNTAQVHKFHVSIAPNAGLHKVLFP